MDAFYKKMNKAEVPEDKEVAGGGMRPYFLYKNTGLLDMLLYSLTPNRQQTYTLPEDPQTQTKSGLIDCQ